MSKVKSPVGSSMPSSHVPQTPPWFQQFATKASYVAGTRYSFLVAILLLLVWAGTGPLFHYSDTWQLVVNTATTIVTFLMVFLIQNTQNRDAKAIHLKLDEIIRSINPAHDEMINIENLSDEELESLAAYYDHVREQFLTHKKKRAAGHRL